MAGPVSQNGQGGLRAELLELLEAVGGGRVEPEHALRRLAGLPFRDLGFARVDTHRELRQDAPEAVLAEGKEPERGRGDRARAPRGRRGQRARHARRRRGARRGAPGRARRSGAPPRPRGLGRAARCPSRAGTW